jgi:hypothetical protein
VRGPSRDINWQAASIPRLEIDEQLSIGANYICVTNERVVSGLEFGARLPSPRPDGESHKLRNDVARAQSRPAESVKLAHCFACGVRPELGARFAPARRPIGKDGI